jgi:uncharacterized RDD family membrane protein YckC
VGGRGLARPTLARVPSPDVLPFETASWGRRALALAVDWFASLLVVVLLMGWDDYTATGGPGGFYTLVVFVVESAVLTCTVGGSFGKMLTRLRTVRVDGGGRLEPLRSLARAILVALVIPPLVFKPDRRGLHDLAAGTATVTLQVAAIRPGQ